MIIHGGKDIENRDWPTRVRGRVVVHAAHGMTLDEWQDAWFFSGSGVRQKAREAGLTRNSIARGGIVGTVEIVDCVTTSDSRWFCGRYGFVLRDPKPLRFMRWRGRLGFFDVPEDVVQELNGPLDLPRVVT